MFEKDEALIRKQIDLLAKWNEKNIKKKPEQARKNIETIIKVIVRIYHT